MGVVEVAAGQDLSAAQRGQLAAAVAASRESDLSSYRQLDSQLHLTWAQMTGSPSLVRSMVASRTRANELLGRIPMTIEPNLIHSHEQHRRIHEAILAGDPESARAAMAEHLDGTAALLRGFLSITTVGVARARASGSVSPLCSSPQLLRDGGPATSRQVAGPPSRSLGLDSLAARWAMRPPARTIST